MEQETNKQENWRDEISEPTATLKIVDKEVVNLKFLGEGKKITHINFGKSIVFPVVKQGENEEKSWYVNAQNFSLLKQIKDLGELKDMRVTVKREGSEKSDTRYTIEKNISI